MSSILERIERDLDRASKSEGPGVVDVIAGSIDHDQAAAINVAINHLAWLSANIELVGDVDMQDVHTILEAVGPVLCRNLPNFSAFEAGL